MLLCKDLTRCDLQTLTGPRLQPWGDGKRGKRGIHGGAAAVAAYSTSGGALEAPALGTRAQALAAQPLAGYFAVL